MKVTAVILCYNAENSITAVLESVQNQTVLPDRLVIVDNSSADGTIQAIEHAGEILPNDRAEIIRLARNGGVGAGHNAGWRRALETGCDLIWSLEHDAVPARTCLERMLECFALDEDRKSIGAIASAMCADAVEMLDAEEHDKLAPPGTQGLVTFNATLIPAAILTRFGMLREDFFVGQEDREFSRRLLFAGMRLVRCTSAKCAHENSKRPSGSKQAIFRAYYSHRNSTYLRCHANGRFVPRQVARHMTLLPVAVVRHLGVLNRPVARAVARLMAGIDGVRGHLGEADYWFLRG